jgi:hypothetical protein
LRQQSRRNAAEAARKAEAETSGTGSSSASNLSQTETSTPSVSVEEEDVVVGGEVEGQEEVVVQEEDEIVKSWEDNEFALEVERDAMISSILLEDVISGLDAQIQRAERQETARLARLAEAERQRLTNDEVRERIQQISPSQNPY